MLETGIYEIITLIEVYLLDIVKDIVMQKKSYNNQLGYD